MKSKMPKHRINTYVTFLFRNARCFRVVSKKNALCACRLNRRVWNPEIVKMEPVVVVTRIPTLQIGATGGERSYNREAAFLRNSILKFPTKVSLDYNYLRLIASFDAARLCSRNESIRVHPNSALFESIHARQKVCPNRKIYSSIDIGYIRANT